MDIERLTLTVEEAARCLGVSRNLAYEMARQHRLPIIKFGRRLLVPRKALLELLEQPTSEVSPSTVNSDTNAQ